MRDVRINTLVSVAEPADQQTHLSVDNSLAGTLLVRNWALLLGCCIVAGLVGLTWTIWVDPTYEASATVVVASADAAAGAQVAAITNTRTLLENRTIAAAVINRFKLDAPPYRLTAADFVAARLSVTQIRDTSYLRIALRMPSAQLAADALNAFLHESIELNRQLSIDNATSVAQGLMKTQLDQARSNVDGRSRQVEEARTAARLDMVKRDVEHASELRAFIRELDGAIQAERARVATAERELASRPRTLTTRRLSSAEGPLLEYTRRLTDEGAPTRVPEVNSLSSFSENRRSAGEQPEPVDTTRKPPSSQVPTTDAKNKTTSRSDTPKDRSAPDSVEDVTRPAPRPLTEGSIGATRTELGPPMPLQMENAFVDPIHEILEYQATMGRTRLAALEAQRTELIKRQGDPVSELYEGQARVSRVELDHELAKEVYKDLALRYEQAREYAVSHAAIIQVADPATTPSHPVAPNRPLVVAAATAVGFLFGLLIVVVRQQPSFQRAAHRGLA